MERKVKIIECGPKSHHRFQVKRWGCKDGSIANGNSWWANDRATAEKMAQEWMA